MQFTNPIALWALLGITLPVAIHLLSRKEGQVIRMGSLRHLHETNTQQFKGIRLNEIVLLSLRSLMILLFVLLLSGLIFEQKTKSEVKWVLVERGLENHRDVKGQLEKFQVEGYELRWLAPDFPLLHDSTKASSVYYRGIVETLSQQNFSKAIVIAQNNINRFSGIRSSLPLNVQWISIAPEPVDYTLNATRYSDSLWVKTGHTDATQTYFTTQRVPASSWTGESQPPDTITINLVADRRYEYDRKIIEAALRSIELSFPIKVEKKLTTAESGFNIWLSDRAISPADITVLYLKPTPGCDLIVQEAANRWRITAPLNEEVSLKENLTLQLASILIPSAQAKVRALQYDLRMAADSVAWDEELTESKAGISHPKSADTYLIGLLLVTLLIERILAYHRNQ